MDTKETLEGLLQSQYADMINAFERAKSETEERELYQPLRQEVPALAQFFDRQQETPEDNFLVRMLNSYNTFLGLQEDAAVITLLANAHQFDDLWDTVEEYIPGYRSILKDLPGMVTFILQYFEQETEQYFSMLPGTICSVAEQNSVSPEAVCESEELRYAVEKMLHPTRSDAVQALKMHIEYARAIYKGIFPLLLGPFIERYTQLTEQGLSNSVIVQSIEDVAKTSAGWVLPHDTAEILFNRMEEYYLAKIDRYYGPMTCPN